MIDMRLQNLAGLGWVGWPGWVGLQRWPKRKAGSINNRCAPRATSRVPKGSSQGQRVVSLYGRPFYSRCSDVLWGGWWAKAANGKRQEPFLCFASLLPLEPLWSFSQDFGSRQGPLAIAIGSATVDDGVYVLTLELSSSPWYRERKIWRHRARI